MTPTVMGYVDALTARPGETVTVRVSVLDASRRYRASLVRLLCGDARPKGPAPKEEAIPSEIDGEHEGIEQYTDCGSYAIVDNLPPLGAVWLSVLAWPSLISGQVQTLMALGPVRLIIDENGRAAIAVGDEVLAFGERLRPRWWHRIAGGYDPATGRASVVSEPFPGISMPRHTGMMRTLAYGKILKSGVQPIGPLVLGAEQIAPGRTTRHFEGKLEAPELRSGAPKERGDSWALELRWDFSRGIGTRRIEDLSPHGLHGTTVNAPKRAVTGSLWDGTVQDWRQNPSHYAAIHFHSDDLYDAGWTKSLEFRLPETLRSGFYAVKLEASGPPFYVGFIVSPKRAPATPWRGPRPGERLAVLASTMTYLAYANYRRRMTPGPFELTMGALPTVDATDLLLAEHPELGASTYDLHPDGSGVSHASARRPLFNFRPTGRFWNFSMDLCLIDWLEAQGIDYDVISDHDLHEMGTALLEPYRAVMTVSHPEYYTLEMLQALESHLHFGGRLMYMGGNGLYWRVTCDPAHPGLIELRRAEDGTRAWAEAPGEYYHATGEYGGLWRRLGWPPNKLVGIGFIAQGFDASSYYRRTAASYDPRASFLFHGIEGEIIGDFGAWGDGAAGLEIDCFDPALGSPPHTLVVASSENHSNAFLMVNEEMLSNSRGLDGTLNPRIHADIVFFEAPSGGAVFATGSIAFVASLAHNRYENSVSRLIRNAI
ncbi:MAG: N,N-dimethylformamidase, partial [Alphaproteobacteria bacterium]|nr:N,N-dimethylformamidase [Alphaproteobacteria bacterium]